MNKTPRLSKTGIEYGDLSWNFYPGCLHKPQGICPVPNCWAEGMSKRQREDFHNPHLIPERLLSPLRHKKPARILVNFMGDLFGDWVDPEMLFNPIGNTVGWLRGAVFNTILACPQHTFIFLTKNPAGLLKWGRFPENCWVGFTACNRDILLSGCKVMQTVEARVKFVSIEPMLEDAWCQSSTLAFAGIKWIIIGAQSRPTVMPELEWVEYMVAVANKAGCRVFLKNNIKPLLATEINGQLVIESHNLWAFKFFKLRQELPE